jgi:hypothetical protein
VSKDSTVDLNVKEFVDALKALNYRAYSVVCMLADKELENHHDDAAGVHGFISIIPAVMTVHKVAGSCTVVKESFGGIWPRPRRRTRDSGRPVGVCPTACKYGGTKSVLAGTRELKICPELTLALSHRRRFCR